MNVLCLILLTLSVLSILYHSKSDCSLRLSVKYHPHMLQPVMDCSVVNWFSPDMFMTILKKIFRQKCIHSCLCLPTKVCSPSISTTSGFRQQSAQFPNAALSDNKSEGNISLWKGVGNLPTLMFHNGFLEDKKKNQFLTPNGRSFYLSHVLILCFFCQSSREVAADEEKFCITLTFWLCLGSTSKVPYL